MGQYWGLQNATSKRSSNFSQAVQCSPSTIGQCQSEKVHSINATHSSESDLDSDVKNSVPVEATGEAAATLLDDDYVDESGGDSDGNLNSVKSGSRRQRQRRAGKAHTSEELLSEAADDAPEDSGSESDDNDRPPRSAAEVQRAFAVWLKANYRFGQRRTCAVCGEWSFWGQPCGRTVERTTNKTALQLCIVCTNSI